MFTFTKKADYALLALSFLSTDGLGRLVGPREIAARYEIPGELLAKVMQTLAKKRLVAVPFPVRPVAIDWDATLFLISVAEVVEAMDGPLAIAQCWEPSHGHRSVRTVTSFVHMRGPLERIQERRWFACCGETTVLPKYVEPKEAWASTLSRPRIFADKAPH